jgi:hypothetical protein
MSELLLTPGRVRVSVAELVPDGVVLDIGGVHRMVPSWPDERRAQRIAGLATRLMQIELFDLDTNPRAALTAVWHRIPHTRELPLSAALALTMSGVPTYSCEVPRSTGAPR